MIKNIIFIESPLQCVNAIDYVQKINKGKSLFFIRLNGSKENDSEIKEIIKKSNLSDAKIYFFKIKPKSLLLVLFLIFCKVVVKLKSKNKKFIFGDFRSRWMSCIFKKIEPERVVFVDDGLATVASMNSLLSYNKKFTLFTVFNVKTKALNIVKNTYIKKIIIGNDIVFIGMPLSEKNILEKNKYIEYLSSIISVYKNQNVIYCPHRSEVNFADEFFLQLGFSSIFRSSENIEIAIENEELTPDIVISFYSTALCNLDLKFNIRKIISYRLESKDINNIYLAAIIKVYHYFELYTNIEISEINGSINR